MKLAKFVNGLLISCSIGMLAGCASKHGAGAYNNGMGAAGGNMSAQANGLGEGENFGSDGVNPGGRHLANKNTYYFDFDSNVVHNDDRPAILSHADRLATNPNKKAIIEGHTDPRGSREYNVALGERRANAVAELMKSKGVSAHQVRVVSYGAERPAASGHTEQDFQLDRRARITGQG